MNGYTQDCFRNRIWAYRHKFSEIRFAEIKNDVHTYIKRVYCIVRVSPNQTFVGDALMKRKNSVCTAMNRIILEIEYGHIDMNFSEIGCSEIKNDVQIFCGFTIY